MSWSGVSVGSCWELCTTVILWDRVAPKHSSGLCVGFVAGWEEMAVTLWGGGGCDLQDICKQDLEVVHYEILVVEKGSSESTNFCWAGRP